MGNTVARCFPFPTDALSAGPWLMQGVDAIRSLVSDNENSGGQLLPTSLPRNSGKTWAGQDGGRKFGTWGSFREPTPNLLPVWYDSISTGAEGIEADT